MKSVAPSADDRKVTRWLQTEAVAANRPRVAQFVRLNVSPEHWRQAELAGAIGILVALSKWPERIGFDDARFWFFARAFVREEIQELLNVGPEPDEDDPNDDGPDGDDGEPMPEVWMRRAA